MDELLSTPIARRGPTSRLLRRQSDVVGVGRTANLERSLHLLDDALGSPVQPPQTRKDVPCSSDATMDVTRYRDITMMDITRPNVDASQIKRMDHTIMDDVTRPFNYQDNNQTANITSAAFLEEENPGVKATENLFDDFLSTSSGGGSGVAALDNVAEFEQMVTDHVDVLKRLVGKVGSAKAKFPKTVTVMEALNNERNTWRLVGKLYNDRLVTCQKPPQDLPPPSPGSERQIIERLFQRSAAVRQAWIVVEWLERNAQDKLDDFYQQVQYFTDATVCWENTLAALERGTGGPNMVKEMDPDAPCRTGKKLHDLDLEDEQRLLKALFVCVRCGLLEEGQDLCVRVGQAWRAATLEGWRLYHDPNYESGTGGGDGGEKLPVEGNKHRDVWKLVAWNLTQDSGLGQFERAVYAALCGNLGELSPVCTSWEDLVWAGAKCSVDVMVETEIRETMVKSFASLPAQYWNTPQSLGKVFQEIEGRGGGVAREAESPYHVIQRHVILDDWPGLSVVMKGWLGAGVDPHLLRLMAHLVLVHRSLGVAGDRVAEDAILQQYTEYLMTSDRLGLVPWYVARLPRDSQLPTYACFLAGIKEAEDQKLCLILGREAGLDMAGTVVAAVAGVRCTEGPEQDLVDSLAWLTHDDSQAGDLLTQTNAVIRKLLLEGKPEVASKAAAMVPPGTLDRASRAWREEEGDLPAGPVREHLALQTYLAAQEAFSDWFGHFYRGQPKRSVLPTNPSFTERVAHEQKEKQYQAEMERWRGGQLVQSRQAEEKLTDVLTFPGGWLLDEEQEEPELDRLRASLLPRTVLLLQSLLHNTGQHTKCLQLADLVASDQHRIFHVYTKQGLRELLAKLRESALAVMEDGECDPWGYAKV